MPEKSFLFEVSPDRSHIVYFVRESPAHWSAHVGAQPIVCGPKVSSRAIFMVLSAFIMTVGSKKLPPPRHPYWGLSREEIGRQGCK